MKDLLDNQYAEIKAMRARIADTQEKLEELQQQRPKLALKVVRKEATKGELNAHDRDVNALSEELRDLKEALAEASAAHDDAVAAKQAAEDERARKEKAKRDASLIKTVKQAAADAQQALEVAAAKLEEFDRAADQANSVANGLNNWAPLHHHQRPQHVAQTILHLFGLKWLPQLDGKGQAPRYSLPDMAASADNDAQDPPPAG